MGVNSLPKTVTRQRRGCDFTPAPSAPESSTLTARLPNTNINYHNHIHKPETLTIFLTLYRGQVSGMVLFWGGLCPETGVQTPRME